jgi:hypothetical protein
MDDRQPREFFVRRVREAFISMFESWFWRLFSLRRVWLSKISVLLSFYFTKYTYPNDPLPSPLTIVKSYIFF